MKVAMVLFVMVVGISGLIGFSLLTAAFVMIKRRGGWQQAMRPAPDGQWSSAMRLMTTGVAISGLCLSVMFISFAVPGASYLGQVGLACSVSYGTLGVLLAVFSVWLLLHAREH